MEKIKNVDLKDVSGGAYGGETAPINQPHMLNEDEKQAVLRNIDPRFSNTVPREYREAIHQHLVEYAERLFATETTVDRVMKELRFRFDELKRNIGL